MDLDSNLSAWRRCGLNSLRVKVQSRLSPSWGSLGLRWAEASLPRAGEGSEGRWQRAGHHSEPPPLMNGGPQSGNQCPGLAACQPRGTVGQRPAGGARQLTDGPVTCKNTSTLVRKRGVLCSPLLLRKQSKAALSDLQCFVRPHGWCF